MTKRKQSQKPNKSIGCLALILLVIIILLMRQLTPSRTQAAATATRMNTATITLMPTMPRATRTPMLQSTQPPKPVIAPESPFGCNQQDDLNCSDFRAIGQNANAHLAQCGDEDRLDQDGDGRACELN